ncbi:MAG: L,D-transpeptidase [Bdellovibrionales bacterium]|nr:L,D-transpeptidase [Bdellovibrionales bacterium]
MFFKFVILNFLLISLPIIANAFDLNDDQSNSKRAKVVIIINEGDRTESNPQGQSLSIYKSGVIYGIYNVSTASNKIKNPTVGKQYVATTPHGFYRPKKVYEDYHSYTFYGASMKYAVFFNGGIATHASEHIEHLGHRASGGCIRLLEPVAELVNSAILSAGGNTRNTVSEDFCNSKGENCHKRSLFVNRIKLHDVDFKTGNKTSNLIWTYDALIIVKPGN